jgi:hypothetical protein
MLKPPVTNFLPVATVFAIDSTASNRGYMIGTGKSQIQCCTLGGKTAIFGNNP